MLSFVAEEAKKPQDERDAWSFFEASLKVPLEDGNALPPALAGQKAAYSALSQEQKVHLSNDLLPLLLARKDELAGNIEGVGTRRLQLAARAVRARNLRRHTRPNDCLISISTNVHVRTKPPRFTL